MLRCYTCNAYLAPHHAVYHARRSDGHTARHILDSLQLRRICCRMHLITAVPLYDDYVRFSNEDVVLDEVGSVLLRHVEHARRVRCDTGSLEPLEVDPHVATSKGDGKGEEDEAMHA